MARAPQPPESDDPIDLSPLARVGGDPRTVRWASTLIRWLTIFIVVIALISAWHIAQAEPLRGRVVAISDGDTLTILDLSRTQHRVRLGGIDAPERGQPFGKRARENLAKRVFQRDVIVNWHKKDRYGRLVGIVVVDGHDVNLEQVRAGFAWWYRDYAKEQTPEDREKYAQAEKTAKAMKAGLWADAVPIPPWEWRRSQRKRN